MAYEIFGNTSYEIWSQQSEITALMEFGHFSASQIISAWDADIPACVVRKVWVRLRWENATLAHVKIAVYNASDPDETKWTVEAVSPELAISDQGHHDGEWCSIECNLLLTAGKKALALISYDTSDAGYGLKVFYISDPSSNDGKVTATVETAFNDPLGTLGPANHYNWCLYAEYEAIPSHVTPGSLYAPVDAIPTVTNGRGIGHESDHDMRYALDNNPDTWWMPDDFGDNSLYVDLGVERTVDALALWLHNYNEAYGLGGKTWQIAYSDDDSTYIPLAAVEFDHGYRAVVLSAFEPTAARYWRVTFSGFDDDPVGPRPEISAIWVTAGYPLPWSHQRPENNKRLYLNNVSTARSGHRFSSAASVGVQRLIERRFVLTKGTGQWENLLGAYKASRGGGLPVIMKTELGSDAFYAVTFDSPLVDSRFAGGYREPRLLLRELGFDRVPFADRSLFPIAETIGLWHLRGNGDDGSGEGHDLYEYESFVDGQWVMGASEHGITALNGSSYARRLQLDAADAGDFDCDVSTDLSMEVWFRIVPGTLTNYCRLQFKYGGAPLTGFNFAIVNGVMYYGSGYDRIVCQFYQSGGARQVHTNAAVQNPSDGEWHHVVVTLDRPTVGMQMYWDGEIVTGNLNHNIIGMTDFSSPTAAFMVIPLFDGMRIDELAFHKGVALSADEVAARYVGRQNHGTWGM